jgi:hemolysin III
MDWWDVREPVNTWTHLAGIVAAVVGTVMLWRHSRDANTLKRLSLLVFGLSLICCYSTSTVFHAVRVPAERFTWFEKLDRIGILVLISGTYTPLAWTLLRGPWRAGTLGLIWGVTLIASVKLIATGPFPLLLNSFIYLAMGWGAVACYPELRRIMPMRDLRLLIWGGVFYSVGAVMNLVNWPVIWPGVFEGHEMFHLFVLAGSLAHFLVMWEVVVPFPARVAA